MKTILITGANGFLGSYLTNKFVESFKIVALETEKSNLSNINKIKDKLKLYIYEKVNLIKFFEENKIDIIIHTATCYGHNNELISNLYNTNVLFPIRLIELAIKNKVKTFINTDSFFNTGELSYNYLGNYTLSKKQLVEWLKLLSNKIQIISLKLFHMYGPLDSEKKFVIQILRKLRDNISEIKMTKGEQKRDFIYISDVVNAYETIIKNLWNIDNGFSTYEIGTGNSISIKEFVITMKNIIGSNSKLNFGAIDYRVNEFMNSKADIEKISKLGWAPEISLNEGLTKLISEHINIY